MSGVPEVSAADWVSGGDYLDTSAGRVFFRVEGRGPALVMLHGFPTWSYDWARVAPLMASDHRVVTLDFPGYGFSAKPRGVDFGVAAAADAVERTLRHLSIDRATLAIHDFGGIVGQELLDRLRRGQLSFGVDAVHVLNNGIVYAAYRPTRAQRLLAIPILGTIVARSLTEARLRAGLNFV
ncbi:MAG: alpha/beta fold hydrolase, partial [Sphingomonas sp.]